MLWLRRRNRYGGSAKQQSACSKYVRKAGRQRFPTHLAIPCPLRTHPQPCLSLWRQRVATDQEAHRRWQPMHRAAASLPRGSPPPGRDPGGHVGGEGQGALRGRGHQSPPKAQDAWTRRAASLSCAKHSTAVSTVCPTSCGLSNPASSTRASAAASHSCSAYNKQRSGSHTTRERRGRWDAGRTRGRRGEARCGRGNLRAARRAEVVGGATAEELAQGGHAMRDHNIVRRLGLGTLRHGVGDIGRGEEHLAEADQLLGERLPDDTTGKPCPADAAARQRHLRARFTARATRRRRWRAPAAPRAPRRH